MKDSIKVLIADDLESERILLKIALRHAPAFRIVGEIEDGLELIRYLKGQGEFADTKKFPWPDLVFLDLKMPKCSGFEVLEWLKNHPLKNAPKILVFTASDEPSDRIKALALGAAGFQTKPLGPKDYLAVVRKLESLYRQGDWEKMDRLPWAD
jgi:two-component system response regulator